MLQHLLYFSMQRTTIMVPDELLQRLRRIAAEQGSSMAAVMREALEEKAQSYHPKPRSLGIGASGVAGTARRAGDERPVPRSWR
jgi:metal-responsive CopG/Arc/MetJ family transcriptional regulator